MKKTKIDEAMPMFRTLVGYWADHMVSMDYEETPTPSNPKKNSDSTYTNAGHATAMRMHRLG